MKPLHIKLISIIAISCLGIAVYSNTFFVPFLFDDKFSIVDDSFIKNIQNLGNVWYILPRRFILYLSLALNYHFNGLHVWGYHLFNLAVHLSSAVLVWWLTLLTFSTPTMKEDRIARHSNVIALFTGLIFVAHPIQTQAVTYIVQRAASMATLFYLASLSLYVQSRLLQNSVIARKGTRQSLIQKFYYTGSLLTAVIAMFTKETAITLPLMILLYEFSFFKPKKNFNWGCVVPFLLTIFIIPITMLLTESYTDRLQQLRSEPGITSMHYLLTQFRVMVTYIRLVFMPLNQNVDYDYPIFKNIFELPVLTSFLFLTAILYFAKRLFSKYRLVSFSIFWFFLTLLPESSILPIKDVIFEHRLYLPMVGYSIFLVSGMYYAFVAWRQNGKGLRLVLAFTMIMIVACYSVLTYQRNKVWKDGFTLWNDTVAKSPHKARAYNNRGWEYYQKGNIVQAMSDYNQAIEIDPNFIMAYYNRGFSYAKQGDLTQAIAEFNKAIAIDPNLATSYSNRGLIYAQQGHLAQAVADYNKAIEIYPDDARVYFNRARIYAQQGHFTQAMSDFARAIEIDPNNANAYYSLGLCFAKLGDLDQAISDYSKAIAINPGYLDAYYNRGLSYGRQNNFTQAVSDYNKDIEIKPNDGQAYNNRAVIYYKLGKYDEAWEDVHKAQGLGVVINPRIITALKTASGKDQ